MAKLTIKDSRLSSERTISELTLGEIFLQDGDVYILTDDNQYMAVDLMTGETVEFYASCRIIPINATLTIE